MSLKEEDRKVIVALELEKIDKTLMQLDVQIQAKLWEMAANRLYYALFHAVSALLINDSHEVGTHRGAVNKFSLFYVKNRPLLQRRRSSLFTSSTTPRGWRLQLFHRYRTERGGREN